MSDFSRATNDQSYPGLVEGRRAASFVHLHVHSEYSLLDGLACLPDLAETARRMGFAALALTDHGAVYGAVRFTRAARAAGVKPILGAELYVVDGYGPPARPASPYHLVVLAADAGGYANLLELITLGHLEHFHKKPLITLEEIAGRSRGLIALSGCLKGRLARLVLAGDRAGARRALGSYGEIFGRDQFLVELQDHGLKEEESANRELIGLARREGFELAATNDVHYLRKADSAVHDLLLAVQTLSLLEEEGRLRLPSPEYYLKSPEEMGRLFAEVPEALSNTLRVAEACRFELELGRRRIPSFTAPDGLGEAEFLRRLCLDALPRAFPNPSGEVLARLEHELNVINDKGFAGYFLIVWDIVSFARRQGIPVGPGRGSSVGSLVAYLLGITSVDPLSHGLLFERFLNPERTEMPDIDVDLCHRGRARVLDYIRERYGRDHVAHLAAFTTLRPRAAARDTGRALGVDYKEIDRLAKAIPPAAPNLEAALGGSEALRALVAGDERLERLIEAARGIEGLPRHLTQHAAGVVVAAGPLTRYVALEEAGDGQIVAQADLESIEDLGLLKIDLLGLRYLTVIDDTLAFLREDGLELSVDNIPLDDERTMDAIGRGETIGVFQLESSGMRGLLRRYRPDGLDDLAIILALYRPGPLGSGMVDSLIRRRHGLEAVGYPHPLLEEVLGSTYGVILYQEQVMETARVMAGYSRAQADLLRKAIAKRQPEIMAREEESFVAGALARGVPSGTAGSVFALISEFGHYGFAKSHSVAYALTSYRTAYLKTNFPAAYHTALLTLNWGIEGRFPAYLSEARRLGHAVLLPDINRSAAGFRPEGGAIRAGLIMVKDLGERGILSILGERNARGPYGSLGDFYRRLRGRGVSARAMGNLIRAGAFDSFGTRAAQLLELHSVWTRSRPAARARRPGQLRLFDLDEEAPDLPAIPPEYGEGIRREMEREVLGSYLNWNPLEQYQRLCRRLRATEVEALIDEPSQEKALLCGLVVSIRSHRTRDGRPMLFAVLEDLTGRVDLVLFPGALERYGHLLSGGEPLLIWGRADRSGESVSFIVEGVRRAAEIDKAGNDPAAEQVPRTGR